MDPSLTSAWQASANDLFVPAISKGNQSLLAFFLLALAVTSTGVFAMNRSFVNIFLLGVPASLALGFGLVYLFCAVGVYV
ncbi:hypothetical protein GGTG_14232 [Gaeumannomyces tritici R3-111a-1]|uniref:Dolichyl-diphosphooligosaccharide-protein glycosyltransferase subunit OST5 n=1 Tax=Gaeumannomyces tritici (strain R3-111a-1) TaxID=644352 RepID=J3PL01_GAET3|nr:hypothetical protein GGTG_14232 [Gaeumannomyces tritici R3-111a-1]EJT68189.1 hypothetical protein GGTG_14232 [Gaeumannomyces tritici R3-111a-1]